MHHRLSQVWATRKWITSSEFLWESLLPTPHIKVYPQPISLSQSLKSFSELYFIIKQNARKIEQKYNTYILSQIHKNKPQKALLLVGGEGIEPSLPCENQILSLARLPIPPLAHNFIKTAADLRTIHHTPYYSTKTSTEEAPKTIKLRTICYNGLYGFQ